MSRRGYTDAGPEFPTALTPAAVLPLVALAVSGRHPMSPLQGDAPCDGQSGHPSLYASSNPVREYPGPVSLGGEALRNPPIGLASFRSRTSMTLEEFWSSVKVFASNTPAAFIDWTDLDPPMTPVGPMVWPKDKARHEDSKPHFDRGHDSPHPDKLILPSRPPRPAPDVDRWVPAVLVVPEPNGGEFQFDIMYRPALPVWLENYDPAAMYATEELYWDGDAGMFDEGDHWLAWVLKSGAYVQQVESRIVPASIAVVGDQPALVNAVKAMAEYWGLSGDWSEWFPVAIGAMTIRLANSSELATLKTAYPAAPLGKAAAQAGVLPRPAELVPGAYLPITLSHDSVCGMCPAFLAPSDDASDPGLITLTGEGWGTDTGISQSMTSTAVVDGVAYNEKGQVVVPGGGPPPPKTGTGVSPLLILGALGVGAYLLTRNS